MNEENKDSLADNQDQPSPENTTTADALSKEVQIFLEPYLKDFKLLLELGFIAIRQKDEISARRIFTAAQVLNPSHNSYKMGFGYIHLHKMEIKQATIIFKGILENEPGNEIVQCLLGMCYALTKGQLARSEKVFRKILSTSQDETVKNLAETLMTWKDNEISKKEPRFFVPTKDDAHLYDGEDPFLQNS